MNDTPKDPNLDRYWMIEKTARLAGADLPRALAEGVISDDTLSDMITRCADCVQGEDCRLRLVEASVPDGAIPGFCMNQEIIEALK